MATFFVTQEADVQQGPVPGGGPRFTGCYPRGGHSKVEPKYPKIALAARITGVVLLRTVIRKDSNIIELQVLSGHLLLIPAAIDAGNSGTSAVLVERLSGRS